jgi:hypothetical protein
MLSGLPYYFNNWSQTRTFLNDYLYSHYPPAGETYPAKQWSVFFLPHPFDWTFSFLPKCGILRSCPYLKKSQLNAFRYSETVDFPTPNSQVATRLMLLLPVPLNFA